MCVCGGAKYSTTTAIYINKVGRVDEQTGGCDTVYCILYETGSEFVRRAIDFFRILARHWVLYTIEQKGAQCWVLGEGDRGVLEGYQNGMFGCPQPRWGVFGISGMLVFRQGQASGAKYRSRETEDDLWLRRVITLDLSKLRNSRCRAERDG